MSGHAIAQAHCLSSELDGWMRAPRFCFLFFSPDGIDKFCGQWQFMQSKIDLVTIYCDKTKATR